MNRDNIEEHGFKPERERNLTADNIDEALRLASQYAEDQWRGADGSDWRVVTIRLIAILDGQPEEVSDGQFKEVGE